MGSLDTTLTLQEKFGLWGLLLGLLAMAFVALRRYYMSCLNAPDDFRNLLMQLRQTPGWLPRYRYYLAVILDKLDDWLKPRYADVQGRPNLARTPFFWQAARWHWAAHAFSRHLSIALAYPLFLLLLFWAIAGTDASGLNILPEHLPAWKRFLTGMLLLFLTFSLVQSNRNSGWKGWAWLTAGVVAGAGAGAVAVAGAVAIAVAFAGVIAFAVAVAGTFAFAVAVAGAGAFAVAVAGAGAGAVAFAVAGAVAVAGASAFDHAISAIHGKLEKKKQLALFYVAFTPLLLLAGILLFSLQPVARNDLVAYMLVFLPIIPLINAIYDWLSLGLTRYLLRKSLDEGQHFISHAAFDLIAALALLVALSLSIVAALAMVNAIAPTSQPPVDLAGILHMLRTQPGNAALWWIYVMIFSTLLPTFFHFGVALMSLPMLQFFPRWRQRVANKLAPLQDPQQSHTAKVQASIYLTAEKFWMVLGAIVVLGLLCAMLLWALPGLARFLLFVCEQVAAWLGTDITPGNVLPITRWS